jgi:hypothetical protein
MMPPPDELPLVVAGVEEDEAALDVLDTNELDALLDKELAAIDDELAREDVALLSELLEALLVELLIELVLDELPPTLSAGAVPLKPVAFSRVKARTKTPSFTTTFSGAKSTRFSSKLQLALFQRLLSKLVNSSRQPPSNTLLVVL